MTGDTNGAGFGYSSVATELKYGFSGIMSLSFQLSGGEVFSFCPLYFLYHLRPLLTQFGTYEPFILSNSVYSDEKSDIGV